jgi:hypothetical protein
MVTTAQVLANLHNSRKSTGPKTDEGKAAVSQNAVKHGLFAESVINGENEQSIRDQVFPRRGTDFQPVENMARSTLSTCSGRALSEVEGMAMPQNRPTEKHGYLEKQSQFASAHVGAKSFVEERYGDKLAVGVKENKANRSQLQAHSSLNRSDRGKITTALPSGAG